MQLGPLGREVTSESPDRPPESTPSHATPCAEAPSGPAAVDKATAITELTPMQSLHQRAEYQPTILRAEAMDTTSPLGKG